MAERPYSRGDYNRALITNALLAPFNVVLLAAIAIAGILVGHVVPILAVGAVAYLAAAARTYFDEDEAQKVLERERSGRRRALEHARVDPRTLAPPIAQLVGQAHDREGRIRDAIERAQLPYSEVSDEVDRFIAVIDGTAQRAQLLWEALAESPPPAIERRLVEVQGDPDKVELAEALKRQHDVSRRMESQLQRFLTEMERVLVELDTVRGNLVSVSASTEAANQQRLAADVRALGDEVGALAEGMSEAYEQREVRAVARSSAPPPVVLQLLDEGDTWSEWGPWTGSSLDGSIRRLRRWPITMVEEVWSEPGRHGYRVLSGLPLRDYEAVVTLTPSNGGTEITWASTFFPKWPGTGWFFEKWLSSVVSQVARRAASAAESRA